MTRPSWFATVVLLAFSVPASLAAQTSISISDSQRAPEVRPIPVSPGVTSRHAVRPAQATETISNSGTPEIPEILSGRKPAMEAPASDTPSDDTPSLNAPATDPIALDAPSSDALRLGPPSVSSKEIVRPQAASQPQSQPPSQQRQTERVAQLNQNVSSGQTGDTSTNSQPFVAPNYSGGQFQSPTQNVGSPQLPPATMNRGGSFGPAPINQPTASSFQPAFQSQPGYSTNQYDNRQTPAPQQVGNTQSSDPQQFAPRQRPQNFSPEQQTVQQQTVTNDASQNWNSSPAAVDSVRTEVRTQVQSARTQDTASQNNPRHDSNIEFDTSFGREDGTDFSNGPKYNQVRTNKTRPSGNRQAPRFSSEMPIHETESEDESATVDSSRMTLQSSSPLVKVSTTGPKTVSVNKMSIYKINVANLGSSSSGALLIAVDIPGHVELSDADLSSGTPEVEEGETSTRILWTIENVQGRSQENMLVKVIPRQALAFDLDVEWTFVPFTEAARVQVTEPRLTMEISGPSEVKYGEKAIYTITLTNPGTGAAEDVLVALSETLGGEQAAVGTIEPGDRKQFEVELIARDAGQISLGATVTADGEIKVPATKPISVRRAKLEVVSTSPTFRYAGSDIVYEVSVANVGDAIAANVLAAIALPKGAEYLSGIDGAVLSDEGDSIRWNIGTMTPGDQKSYRVTCVLHQPGNARLEVGARGDEQLAASSVTSTQVDALADLTLKVRDPRGPQQVGDEVQYEITVENRGTKEATNVNLVGQFSPGIEPLRTEGLESRVVPGSVAFETIPSIPVGSTVVVKVYAKADEQGTHTFRTELDCKDQDIRRVSEGTTKYFVTPEAYREREERLSEGTIDNGFDR